MADQPKPGSIVHVEFHVKDRKKVENFYGSLFGWKFQEVPELNYSIFEAPSGPGGGVGGLQPGNWPSGVINYIFVESIEPFQERIKKAGGKIIAPKMEIPGQGWFAVFEDPSGTRMALWQPSPQYAVAEPLVGAVTRLIGRVRGGRRRLRGNAAESLRRTDEQALGTLVADLSGRGAPERLMRFLEGMGHDRVRPDRDIVADHDVAEQLGARADVDIVPDRRGPVVESHLGPDVRPDVDAAILPDPRVRAHHHGTAVGDREPRPEDVGEDDESETSFHQVEAHVQEPRMRPTERGPLAICIIFDLSEETLESPGVIDERSGPPSGLAMGQAVRL